MASFLLNSTSTTARTLNGGESGYIGPQGALLTAGAAVTMNTGDFLSSKLVVDGAIASMNSYGVSSNGGNGMQLTVGEDGSIASPKNYAINVTNASTSSDITSAGTITGGINFDQDSNESGTLSLVNTGNISNSGSGVDISGYRGEFHVFNSGTISGYDAISMSDFSNSSMALKLFNTGDLVANSGTSATVVRGAAGADVVINSGQIIGTVRLEDGGDFFNGINGYQTIVLGEAGNDRIYASSNRESLFGGDDSDVIFGNGGEDRIFGGNGNDIMRGGSEKDEFNGGSGTDWVYYQTSDEGVEVDLTSGFGFGGHAQNDTYVGVERVAGSRYSDEINGSGADNYFTGSDGNDVMRGYGGNDIMRGDDGADVMHGGSGFDWLFYSASNGGVDVNLTIGSASGGHASGDVYSSIERLGGSQYGDKLTGTSGGNQINGLNGNDTIRGYLGNDLMNGGGGADTFVMDNNGGHDIVSDFTNDVDKLDLQAWGYSNFAQVATDVSTSGADLYITLDGNDQIRLVGFAGNIGDLADDLIL